MDTYSVIANGIISKAKVDAALIRDAGFKQFPVVRQLKDPTIIDKIEESRMNSEEFRSLVIKLIDDNKSTANTVQLFTLVLGFLYIAGSNTRWIIDISKEKLIEIMNSAKPNNDDNKPKPNDNPKPETEKPDYDPAHKIFFSAIDEIDDISEKALEKYNKKKMCNKVLNKIRPRIVDVFNNASEETKNVAVMEYNVFYKHFYACLIDAVQISTSATYNILVQLFTRAVRAMSASDPFPELKGMREDLEAIRNASNEEYLPSTIISDLMAETAKKLFAADKDQKLIFDLVEEIGFTASYVVDKYSDTRSAEFCRLLQVFINQLQLTAVDNPSIIRQQLSDIVKYYIDNGVELGIARLNELCEYWLNKGSTTTATVSNTVNGARAQSQNQRIPLTNPLPVIGGRQEQQSVQTQVPSQSQQSVQGQTQVPSQSQSVQAQGQQSVNPTARVYNPREGATAEDKLKELQGKISFIGGRDLNDDLLNAMINVFIESGRIKRDLKNKGAKNNVLMKEVPLDRYQIPDDIRNWCDMVLEVESDTENDPVVIFYQVVPAWNAKAKALTNRKVIVKASELPKKKSDTKPNSNKKSETNKGNEVKTDNKPETEEVKTDKKIETNKGNEVKTDNKPEQATEKVA